MVLLTVTLSSCGNDKTFIINGKEVVAETYGLMNDDKKVPGVEYEVSFGSVFWAVVLSETLIVPIYIVGWDIMQPVKVNE